MYIINRQSPLKPTALPYDEFDVCPSDIFLCIHRAEVPVGGGSSFGRLCPASLQGVNVLCELQASLAGPGSEPLVGPHPGDHVCLFSTIPQESGPWTSSQFSQSTPTTVPKQ